MNAYCVFHIIKSYNISNESINHSITEIGEKDNDIIIRISHYGTITKVDS